MTNRHPIFLRRLGPPAGRRLIGAVLAIAFLFSGDLVRLHGHADGVPASKHCAACLAGLASAVKAAPTPDVTPPVESGEWAVCEAPFLAPSLPFLRPCGLRDPPPSFA
jgi:hypothetical protein